MPITLEESIRRYGTKDHPKAGGPFRRKGFDTPKFCTIQLSEPLHARLKSAAEREGRTITRVVSRELEAYVTRADAALALQSTPIDWSAVGVERGGDLG